MQEKIKQIEGKVARMGGSNYRTTPLSYRPTPCSSFCSGKSTSSASHSCCSAIRGTDSLAVAAGLPAARGWETVGNLPGRRVLWPFQRRSTVPPPQVKRSSADARMPEPDRSSIPATLAGKGFSEVWQVWHFVQEMNFRFHALAIMGEKGLDLWPHKPAHG